MACERCMCQRCENERHSLLQRIASLEQWVGKKSPPKIPVGVAYDGDEPIIDARAPVIASELGDRARELLVWLRKRQDKGFRAMRDEVTEDIVHELTSRELARSSGAELTITALGDRVARYMEERKKNG